MKTRIEHEEVKTNQEWREQESFEALQKIMAVLEPLPAIEQARIINTLVVFFEIPT